MAPLCHCGKCNFEIFQENIKKGAEKIHVGSLYKIPKYRALIDEAIASKQYKERWNKQRTIIFEIQRIPEEKSKAVLEDPLK